MSKSAIDLTIDAAPSMSHKKIMIINGKTLLTGSFNATKAADERNVAMCLLFKMNKLVADILGGGRESGTAGDEESPIILMSSDSECIS